MHERPEIDRELAIILEALDSGVIPSQPAIKELESLGLMEKGPAGYRMTLTAKLKLETLRIKREREVMEMRLSKDVSRSAERQASR